MTPEEFSVKMQAIAYKIPAIIQASLEQGVNTVYAEMNNRIFNKHQTITGSSFGGYESDAYAQLRASIGRQSGTKDLQVYGNLQNSIGVNYEKRAIVMDNSIKIKSIPTKKGKIRSADPFDVANGQELQIVGTPGRGIFEASQDEVKQAIKSISYTFTKLMQEAIGTV